MALGVSFSDPHLFGIDGIQRLIGTIKQDKHKGQQGKPDDDGGQDQGLGQRIGKRGGHRRHLLIRYQRRAPAFQATNGKYHQIDCIAGQHESENEANQMPV